LSDPAKSGFLLTASSDSFAATASHIVAPIPVNTTANTAPNTVKSNASIIINNSNK
jgi:hypothetical protein